MRLFDYVWIICASVGLSACASGSEIDYRELYVGETDAATVLPSTESDAGAGIAPVWPDAAAPGPTYDAGAELEESDSSVYVEPSDAASGGFDAGRPDVDSGTLACTLALSTGDPSCDSCIGASCCAPDQECGADPDCLSFAECATLCEMPEITPGAADAGGDSATDGGTMSCLDACEEQYPAGANELGLLDSCLEGTCGASCGGQ